MRHRSKEPPPTQADIDRILREGATADDRVRFHQFLRRMQKAFFLDAGNKPHCAQVRLIEQYGNDGLVLFLGAGVSKGSGIPNWPDLTDALLLKSGVACDDLAAVKKALPFHITQFELAGRRLGNYRKLVEAIYEGLYERMECKSLVQEIPVPYEKQNVWPK